MMNLPLIGDEQHAKRNALIALVVGYFASLSVARLNWTFDQGLDTYFGGFLGRSWALVMFFIFLLCAIVFAQNFKPLRQSEKFDRLRSIDPFLLTAIIAGVACFFLAMIAQGSREGLFLLIASALTYALTMVAGAELFHRVRDKQLLATSHWQQFFKLNPLNTAMGALIAALLVILAFLFFVSFVRLSYESFLVFALITAVFGALTYLVTYIVTLGEQFESAHAEKLRAEQFKVELITNVSHDIKTPLTSITSYIALLRDMDIEDETVNSYVGILDAKSKRLDVLINDLMDASKASTGAVAVDMRHINLNEIIGQVAGELDDQLAERELTLVLRHPEEPVMVWADTAHLWRILENLLTNATKYSLTGTRVFIEVSSADPKTTLSIKNTSAMPIETDGEMLTEQFIRGDRSRNAEGSGLGLYIAKSLAELMGAQFEIDVAGDLFEVRIGFADEEIEKENAKTEAEARENAPGKAVLRKVALPLWAILAGATTLVIGAFIVSSVLRTGYVSMGFPTYNPYHDPVYDPYGDSAYIDSEPYEYYVGPESDYPDRETYEYELTTRLLTFWNPYVGDMQKNNRLIEELGIWHLGSPIVQLHTDERPYVMEFIFEPLLYDGNDTEQRSKERVETIDAKMSVNAKVLLALIGNVDEVKWTIRTSQNEDELERRLTFEEVNRQFSDLFDAEFDSLKESYRNNVLFGRFLSRIGYFDDK